MSHECATSDGKYAPSKCGVCIGLVGELKEAVNDDRSFKRIHKKLHHILAIAYGRRVKNTRWADTAANFFDSEADADMLRLVNYVPNPRRSVSADGSIVNTSTISRKFSKGMNKYSAQTTSILN